MPSALGHHCDDAPGHIGIYDDRDKRPTRNVGGEALGRLAARVQELRRSRACGILACSVIPHDRSNKAVASTIHGGDISIALLAIAQDSPQHCNLDLEIALLNRDSGPGSRNQFLLAHHLSRALDKCNQEVKGAATEVHRFVTFEQESPTRT